MLDDLKNVQQADMEPVQETDSAGSEKKVKTDKERFQEWYEKHGEEYNEKRAQRYATDPEYREKAKIRARRYYWLRKQAKRTERPKKPFTIPSADRYIVITIDDPNDIRYGMSIEVPAYFIGTICKIVDKTVATIRNWERDGVIPPSNFRSDDNRNYRLYTLDQVRAIADNAHLLSVPSKKMTESPFSIAVREAWAAMPCGVEPMPRSEWRLTPKCKACGSEPGLEHFDEETGEWVPVECLRCGGFLARGLEQAQVEFEGGEILADGRERIRSMVAEGTCPECGKWVTYGPVEVAGKPYPVVNCSRCGKEIPDEYLIWKEQ